MSVDNKVTLAPPIKGLNARVSSIFYNNVTEDEKVRGDCIPTNLILSEWDDEHLEVEDSRLAQKYIDANFDSRLDFLEKVGTNYPIKEVINIYMAFNYSFPSENSKQHFGDDVTFDNLEKTFEGMLKGRASDRVLKQVEASENEFSESFNNSESEIQSIKKKRVFSDCGAELDIDRVMSGDSNYWAGKQKTKGAKVIRLAFDVGMSYDNTSIQFAKVVGVGIALAKAIQKAGYSLEIYKVQKAKMKGYKDIYRTSGNKVSPGYVDVKGRRGYKEKNREKTTEARGVKIQIKGAQELIDAGRLSNIGVVGVFRASMWRAQVIATGHFNGYPTNTWSEADMEAYGIDCVVSNRWVGGQQKMLVQNLIKKLGL